MIDCVLSNYQVIRRLGQGGMGVVYLAEDLALGRQVALKILAPHLVEDRTFMARFHAEARNQARLFHPNITLVYAFEEWEGQAFLVMEYIDGESLEDRIQRQGRFHSREALAIFREVLPAINYAHSQGVIHRDIKPSNIAITKDEIIKIMDFGIALHLGETSRLTTPDHIVGTPHYMAPEQIRGLALDYRTDIYALGVTLFEMVTGRVPFDASSDFEIRRSHVTTPPPSPRAYGYPDITPALEEVILKALAKNPAGRFASAQEFLQAFEAAFPQRETPVIQGPRVGAPDSVSPTIPGSQPDGESNQNRALSKWMMISVPAALTLILGGLIFYRPTLSFLSAGPHRTEVASIPAKTTESTSITTPLPTAKPTVLSPRTPEPDLAKLARTLKDKLQEAGFPHLQVAITADDKVSIRGMVRNPEQKERVIAVTQIIGSTVPINYDGLKIAVQAKKKGVEFRESMETQPVMAQPQAIPRSQPSPAPLPPKKPQPAELQFGFGTPKVEKVR